MHISVHELNLEIVLCYIDKRTLQFFWVMMQGISNIILVVYLKWEQVTNCNEIDGRQSFSGIDINI